MNNSSINLDGGGMASQINDIFLFHSCLPTYSAVMIADFFMVRQSSNKHQLLVGLKELLGERF